MNQDRIIATLEKIPLVLLLVLYGGYVGYDYFYAFKSGSSSPYLAKKSELENVQKATSALDDKIRRAKEFYKTLDQKRAEIRNLSLQLDQLKATLSEELDLPSFMKMVTTEAERVGVNVTTIRPGESKREEFTMAQSYEIDFHAVYIQLLVFLQRLATLERIIRVEAMTFKPNSAGATDTSAGYVELSGTLLLKTYRYIGTAAEEGKPATPGAAAPPKKAGE